MFFLYINLLVSDRDVSESSGALRRFFRFCRGQDHIAKTSEILGKGWVHGRLCGGEDVLVPSPACRTELRSLGNLLPTRSGQVTPRVRARGQRRRQ